MPSAADALYDLVTARGRVAVVVGTAKNTGKTTTFNTLCAVAVRRGVAIAITSIGRDGEGADALDGEAKPRIRIAAGTLVALPYGLVPQSPAFEILEVGARTSLGRMVVARARVATSCEIGGPPTAREMRATIDRLDALCGDGRVFVDGALDRIAPLAGGTDAVVLATGAESGATIAAVAAAAADAMLRLRLPGRDSRAERPRFVRLGGALDARIAQELLRDARDATVVVDDPTRITVRGTLLRALLDAVDVRCERPLRIVACTTTPFGRGRAFDARALVRAVAAATGVPTFDVISGVTQEHAAATVPA